MTARPRPSADLTVRMLPIGRVQPYPGNPRKNEAAVEKVAASLREFGFRQPIVCDEKLVVLAGHTRLQAALRLGLKRVPVHVATGLTAAQAKAYRLADNRTHEDAEWDVDLLAQELASLRDLDFDLGLTGFEPQELTRLLAGGGLVDGADPDRTPALPSLEDTVTKPGDLIVLGRHRLLCGDSTKAPDVERLLGDARPALMVTDPPYGVEYDADWRNNVIRDNGTVVGARAVGVVNNDDRFDWREAWALFPGAVVYCWHAGVHAGAVQASLEAAGFGVRSQIIWAKNRLVISRGHYHWQHEPCWYAVRAGSAAAWVGDRSQTLWEIEHRKSETGHSAQKPVEAMRRPLHNHEGDVYDPFLGSGTTLVAAEMEHRACYGMEIDPRYCDVVVQRWEQATGLRAVRP